MGEIPIGESPILLDMALEVLGHGPRSLDTQRLTAPYMFPHFLHGSPSGSSQGFLRLLGDMMLQVLCHIENEIEEIRVIGMQMKAEPSDSD